MSTAEVIKLAEEYKLDDIMVSPYSDHLRVFVFQGQLIDAAKSSSYLAKKFDDLDSFSIDTLKKVISKTLSLV